MNTTSTGKRIRMGRLKYPGASTGLIVPLDHGLTIGPVTGLRNLDEIAEWIQSPAICSIVAHKGMIERLAARDLLSGKGVFLHLNGMSALAPIPNRKEMLTSVEAAARMGVDGVSVQLNFDHENDAHHMALLGGVVDEAQKYSLPVLTMLYDKIEIADDKKRFSRLNHLVRIAIELGTDVIKLSPPRSQAEMSGILEYAKDDVDIYFAGGELSLDDEILELAKNAVLYGACGLCVGRNIFQRPNARRMLEELKLVLTEGIGRPLEINLANLSLSRFSENRV